jgi:hypothetical protein
MCAPIFRTILAFAAIALLLPQRAGADLPLDAAGQRCASAVLGASVKVLRAYGKAAAKCTKQIVTGTSSETAVAACVFADTSGKLATTQLKADQTIAGRCTALPYAFDCIAPCDAADAAGPSSAVDDLAELQGCIACLNPATSISGASDDPPLAGLHGAILDGVTLGPPSNAALGQCQSAIVKTYDKLFGTEAKELARCAQGELGDGATSPPDACVGSDPRLVVAKARTKLASVVARCTDVGAIFDTGACGGVEGNALAGCLDTVVSCKACRWAAVELGSAFDCDAFDDGQANGSCAPTTDTVCTTTTTSPPTTLYVPDCPDLVELTVRGNVTTDACTTNDDCSTGTCDTSLGRCRTQTELDWGATGYAHDTDISDGTARRMTINCPNGDGSTGSCGNCWIGQYFEPWPRSCRCANDPRLVCGSCGANACECYASPPLPITVTNDPLCRVERYEKPRKGNINVDTGAISLDTTLRTQIFFGDSMLDPCPFCGGKCAAGTVDEPCVRDSDCDTSTGAGDGACNSFDVTPRDGVRDGTCVGGMSDGLACDVDALNATFPVDGTGGTSLDCLPSAGRNLSGAGVIERQHHTTSAAAALTASVLCGFNGSDSCHCGACSEDQTVACMSNADCARQPATCTPSLGVCEPLTNFSRPNECDDGDCTDIGGGEGECATGPDNKFCDGLTRADGRGLFSCLSNSDCDAPVIDGNMGNCTLSERLECFPDTISAAGAADPTKPLTTSLACAPTFQLGGIDAQLVGLPGPLRLTEQLEMRALCAGNHEVVYTPGVGGCPTF